MLLFLILFAKLADVQIIRGSYYRNLSDQNRIRRILIPAPRGRILASNGEELATNIQVKKGIKFGANGKIEVTDDLTGASQGDILTDYRRVYPLGSVTAHAVGYLSAVNDREVGTTDPNCPEKGPRISGMLVGKTGLEEKYECLLLGTPGEELVEVDTTGKKIRVLAVKKSIPGQDLKTSINHNLQIEVAKEMEGKPGAVIVTDTSGKIIAFYSSPSFDPTKIADYLTSPNLPFFDRAISGTFHPGSVFKPIVAIAALESGVIDKNFLYNDTGKISVNGFDYTNWYFTQYGRTEGEINLTKAIARSTDTFFYKIGEMTGPENLAKWADTFGLNQKTGIDLPAEASGLIPTPEWKEKTKKEPWYLGNTYHMAIGQGDVSVTPIEINTYISAIAMNGKLCQPHFSDSSSPLCKNIAIDKNNVSLVKEGMKEACSQGGTAFTFFDFSDKNNGIQVACKTGTAEVSLDGNPHAWFTVFAPAESPKYVATVLFEAGGEGSSVAGPVARKIMDFLAPMMSQ